MQHTGNLTKMKTVLNTPVDYFLKLGENDVSLNQLIGRKISLQFKGVINCVHCGKQTKKSYSQGFCFNCMQTSPEADESVIHPELSKAEFGIAKDMDWAEKHDLIDHYVYLSITNDLKVGVTRYHQIPTRWIDQGAVQAIKMAKTPNRHIAGVIECYLKKHVADITKWQAMLRGETVFNVNLEAEKHRIGALLPLELQRYIETDNEITSIVYPGEFNSDKMESVTFDKMAKISGILSRIKGQYLMFANGNVLNIRKHTGYLINFEVFE